MAYTIWQYIFIFFLYSIMGWLSEVSYAALVTGKLVNRGFLNGPLCPIYGSGMVAILFFIGPWVNNIFVVFFGGMVITTLVELIGGIILFRVFHTRWWDYTDERLNLGGFICLKFSLVWGVGSILLVMVCHPIVKSLMMLIPSIPLMISDCVLVFFFGLDMGVSFAAAVGLNRDLAQIDELRAALRKSSDAITQVVGSNVISADEMMDAQKLQLALAKLEGRESAQQLKAEISARQLELAANFRRVMDELARQSHFGAGRLLRAFPDMKTLTHNESLAFLRRFAQKGAARLSNALHGESVLGSGGKHDTAAEQTNPVDDAEREAPPSPEETVVSAPADALNLAACAPIANADGSLPDMAVSVASSQSETL